MKRCLPLLICAMLTACTARQQPPMQDFSPAPQQPCTTAWVYAPGNYIIDIAAEAEVLLDPTVQAFPVYCEPEEARTALDAEIAAGRLPRGEWRIYRLEGAFADLAAMDNGRYILARMARMEDWAK